MSKKCVTKLRSLLLPPSDVPAAKYSVKDRHITVAAAVIDGEMEGRGWCRGEWGWMSVAGEEKVDHLLVFPVDEVVGCLVDKGHFGSLQRPTTRGGGSVQERRKSGTGELPTTDVQITVRAGLRGRGWGSSSTQIGEKHQQGEKGKGSRWNARS